MSTVTHHIVSAADDAYVQHFAVMLESFLRHNDVHCTVFLLTTELAPDTERKLNAFVHERRIDLRVIDVRPHVQRLRGAKVTHHVTLATYFRFLMPELLPADLRRVLYLDVDLLVLGDISHLFDVDLKQRAVAAVPDAVGGHHFRDHDLDRPDDYFNAGVLAIDLDHWRRHAIAARALHYATTNPERLHYWDQCALNAVLKNNVLYLDERWNLQTTLYGDLTPDLLVQRDARILHYCGVSKPWRYESELATGELYWEHLRRTPWSGFVPPDRTVRNRLKRLVPRPVLQALRDVRAYASKSAISRPH